MMDAQWETAIARLSTNHDQSRAEIDAWMRSIGKKSASLMAIALLDDSWPRNNKEFRRIVNDLAAIALGDSFIRVFGGGDDSQPIDSGI